MLRGRRDRHVLWLSLYSAPPFDRKATDMSDVPVLQGAAKSSENLVLENLDLI